MALVDDLDILHNRREGEKNELSASVVIPFHIGRELLSKTITSLTQQSYPKDLFEVIIVADANHTDAKVVADKYKNQIRLKLVMLFNNQCGAASSRNAGILVSKGDIVVSLDCDMICPPNFLVSHMAWFHKSDKIATIGLRKFVRGDRIQPEDIIRDFSLVTSLPEISSISNTSIGRRKDKRITELEHLSLHPFPGNCFHGGNVAYWRDDATDIGLWDEAFDGNYGYEDIEFGQRLFENGTKMVYENDATAYHQESNFVSANERQTGLSINRLKLYERFPSLGRFRQEILGLQ